MENIFINFLPPWVETGLQPAFYDKESGTVLQQTARMYAKVNELIQNFNTFSTDVTTTVNDYIEQFNELHDYVHDYFDNLDVQEEINNKLDAMADDGTLQSIIYDYLNSVALFCYDTLADMKLAENFVAGSYAKTMGYYSLNDKGGATYKIRTKTESDDADEMTLIALSDDSLIAELIITNEMNVKQFGAEGDGTNDDTANIQCALDNCKNITVPSGTYMINAVTHIAPNSNSKITLSEDATIKAITNSEGTYAVIYLNDVDNVEICGGTISGDKTTHTGNTGEWGHCIHIAGGSTNIRIHDIRLIDAWGDGLYVNDCTDVWTERVIVDNARRNGYSIICATNFISNDDKIKNVSGTNPQAGVDIEPNANTDVLTNIIFNNLVSVGHHNTGFGIALGADIENTTPYDIRVNNLITDNTDRGVVFDIRSQTLTGYIEFNNTNVNNTTRQGICATSYNYSPNMEIVLNNPVVKNYGLNSGSAVEAIQFTSTSNTDGGNVTINQPLVIPSSDYTASRAIGLYSRGRSYPWHKFIVDTPLDLGQKGILLGQGLGVKVFDKLETCTLDVTENSQIKNDYYSVVTNAGTAQNVRVILAENTTVVNEVITFRVVEDYTITLRFTSQYIYPLSSSISQDVTLSGVGTSVTIKKISNTEWTVLNSVGNVTV